MTLPTLKPSSPEQVDESQALLRQAFRPPQTLAKNVGLASNMEASSYFEYRARRYRVPPVSYQLGIQLQEIQIEFQKLGDEDTLESMSRLRQLCNIAVTMFPTVCEPANWLVCQLWRRRWLRNPFLSATPQEVAQLLGFFSLCRMKSSVRLEGGLALRPALSSLMQHTN